MKDWPATLELPARTAARGRVALPGSKSISNRVLLLAALAQGRTRVRGLLEADDTAVMLAALRALGVAVESLGGNDYALSGCGGKFPVPEADLFLGNAGTAFRPLTAALALAPGTSRYRLSGVPRMHERPVGDLVDALGHCGADVRYLGKPGYPPVEIAARRAAACAEIPIRGDVSSQFLSALLMALPLLGQRSVVRIVGDLISRPYVQITLNLMRRFGVAVQELDAHRFAVDAGAGYASPGDIRVEGDASSASYFLAAGAIGGGPVRVEGVGRDSIQGDVQFAAVLGTMGARIAMGEDWIEARAPESGRLSAIDADLNAIPDAAMTIAVCALFAEGTTTIRNVASWRVKETDRLAAMARELGRLGARVEEGADFLRITPPHALQAPAVPIATYDDHRMAMCFSLASLAGIGVTLDDPKCVAKTFPGFFEALEGVLS